MAGVSRLEITETAEELKQILARQKTATGKERVQVLYLLKTGNAPTLSQAAVMIGRHRVTAQKWIQQYQTSPIESLMEQKQSSARPRAIPSCAEKALDQKLQHEQGFNDYQEIVEWLEKSLGIKARYKTAHKLVYYRLKASPRLTRPQSIKQDKAEIEAFKKTSQST
ncbi:helix-turn-helix domain-containing protein [Microcoleus sp. FACHB-68]|uniref:helix-turn-helix domain-containing protein n=1 Tax=Microcoleus sp. FACHB-68 TaxID=2692826 RepID=UPI001682D6B3|nr:helix-turn-helix domain-containing protein [Microcoleus sp. FACHB-68]MBD1940739.1 winged helix-turn-helix domain-containing protein [Microcoleus sp. FACHB-68]